MKLSGSVAAAAAVLALAAAADAADGRFQIVLGEVTVGRGTIDEQERQVEKVIIKIDTETGRTWVYENRLYLAGQRKPADPLDIYMVSMGWQKIQDEAVTFCMKAGKTVPCSGTD
jgi:hypothetical protein